MKGSILSLVACACLGACSNGAGEGAARPNPSLPDLHVTSSALVANQPIPAAYACADDDHLGKSPPLAWSAGPEGTSGYAVTVVDPDAHGFVHWALAGVPTGVTSLVDGASPGGALPQGAHDLPNDFGKPGYGGPCPPKGKPHHYVFKVWALKAPVDAAKADAGFFDALAKNAIAAGEISVTHRR